MSSGFAALHPPTHPRCYRIWEKNKTWLFPHVGYLTRGGRSASEIKAFGFFVFFLAVVRLPGLKTLRPEMEMRKLPKRRKMLKRPVCVLHPFDKRLPACPGSGPPVNLQNSSYVTRLPFNSGRKVLGGKATCSFFFFLFFFLCGRWRQHRARRMEKGGWRWRRKVSWLLFF